jgi:hypothetical protein
MLIVLLPKIFLGIYGLTEGSHGYSEFLLAASTDGDYGRAGQPFDNPKAGLFHPPQFPIELGHLATAENFKLRHYQFHG